MPPPSPLPHSSDCPHSKILETLLATWLAVGPPRMLFGAADSMITGTMMDSLSLTTALRFTAIRVRMDRLVIFLASVRYFISRRILSVRTIESYFRLEMRGS